MITRRHGNLRLRRPDPPAPAAAHQLEREGFARLRGVLPADDIAALKAEIEAIYAASPPDRERDENGEFRHAMFNRSPLSQKAIAAPAILEAIEPLLGEDCHVIANTCWRNVAGHQGGAWHTDAGPHIPRPEGVPWPDAIPWPVFAIGMHLFIEDCPEEAGPTAVLPTSHRSGRSPPSDRLFDSGLTFENRTAVTLPARAGDAILFVSDLWHRGTPAKQGYGRFFLQAHYGRRDLAQRIYPTAEVSHAGAAAADRAASERERTLIGLHPIYFYDG